MLLASFSLATLAILLLLYAALHDLAARTVPNWLPAGLFVLGILLRGIDHSLIIGLAICLGTFALLFAIWVVGAVGGGDVKLWAASVLLIPPVWQTETNFFLRVVLFGGALAVLYLLAGYLPAGFLLPRRPAVPAPCRRRPLWRRVAGAESWRISRRAPLPYACAIAAAAIIALLPAGLSQFR